MGSSTPSCIRATVRDLHFLVEPRLQAMDALVVVTGIEAFVEMDIDVAAAAAPGTD